MKKQEKHALVEDLTQSFGRASIALVSEYRGMTAAESTEMRKRLRAVRGEMRVAKNTLVRLAIKGTPYEALDDKLGGQIGLILSYEDPVALAKTFTSFGPLGDKLKLRGAVLGGKPLSVEEVQALATLPPREVVFGQLLGLLNAPGSYLARVIDAIGKKNGEGAVSASAESAPAASGETPSSETPSGEAPPAASEPAANS